MDESQQAATERCIAGIGKWSKRLAVPGEIRRLPGALEHGELPLMAVAALVQGPSFGILMATDTRLVWLDKGLLTFSKDIMNYERISSINMSTGIVGGSIEINMYDHVRVFSFIMNPQVFPMGNLIREHSLGRGFRLTLTDVESRPQAPKSQG